MRHFRNALENCALISGSCKGKIVSNGWVYSCRLWLLITSPHNLWLWRKQVIHFDSCHSSICHFALSCHLHEQLKKLLLAVPLLSSSCWLSLKDKWHWGMTCCSAALFPKSGSPVTCHLPSYWPQLRQNTQSNQFCI